ncbi:hypothetical protein BK634_13285 [Pseudomonas chlororaphis]|nr:hypothetical protein BK634_13285 [Pseudomonas chlororaphis]
MIDMHMSNENVRDLFGGHTNRLEIFKKSTTKTLAEQFTGPRVYQNSMTIDLDQININRGFNIFGHKGLVQKFIDSSGIFALQKLIGVQWNRTIRYSRNLRATDVNAVELRRLLQAAGRSEGGLSSNPGVSGFSSVNTDCTHHKRQRQSDGAK